MRQFLVLIRSPVLPCEGVGDVATARGAVIAMGVALREVVDGAGAPKCSENNYNYFGKQWEPTKNEVKRSHARVTVAAKVIAHKLRPIKNEGFLIIKFH